MNILYTTDRKYIDIMLASILSLIENSGFDNINLHIVEEGFIEKDFDRIKRLVDLFEEVSVKFYDFKKCPIEKFNIPNWRGTQIANARLLYPSIINAEENVDNLLYLDSDTIVTGKLNNITEYSDNMISACREDVMHKSYYKNLGLKRYVNSGVLYFNCNELSKFNMEDSIKEITSNKDIKLTFPDQDLINIMFNEKIEIMPTRYNMSPYSFFLNDIENFLYYSKRQLSYNEIINERNHAKILHAFGLFNIKPWCENSINPFNNIFLNYAYRANADFKLEELKDAKKFFNENPHILKSVLMVKTFLPNNIEEKSRQLSLKLQNKSKK